ncbi:hypothetical protein V2S66_26915 [Streptomyces sp. V4-01]|uniref:Diaminopimelate decarboxylase n=1 Tax=Actinacidiphila polyblastidii TaxID=3110430 RepID=A0ABU7PIC9_9ACTN|nr:hypothetical protein [Streptomyces sp. V4-01]
MTLSHHFPTFHRMLHARLDPGRWPPGTRITADGDMLVGGVALTRVAARHGTPAAVLDVAEVRRRCAAHRAALPWADLGWSAAALAAPGVLRLVAAQGLSVTVGSVAELAAARAAGVPAAATLARRPLPGFAGAVVLRDPREAGEHPDRAAAPRPVLLAVALRGHGPGVAPGDAVEAVRRLLAGPGVRLAGLHAVPGPPGSRVSAYEAAVRVLLAVASALREAHGVAVERLHLSGDGVVPASDPHGLAQRLRTAMDYECRVLRLPAPRLTLETGRALLAPAAVTLLRVVTATGAAVTLEGPLTGSVAGPLTGPVGDTFAQPRSAIPGAPAAPFAEPSAAAHAGPFDPYAEPSAEPAPGPDPAVRLVGRSQGAKLRTVGVGGPGEGPRRLPLPEDVAPGDLLAVAHRVGGPALACGPGHALVAVEDGAARLLTE